MSEQAFGGGRRGSVDFLTGTPWKRILRFSVPLLFGNLFQQLYNTVDSIIVGRGVGHVALAAAGLSGPILWMLISVFMGVATGSSILVSQYYGAKNEAALRRTLHTSIVLALIVGLFLSLIGLVFAPAILRFMNTPDDAYPLALTYMRILFSGIIWQMMYNMLSGFMRGLGNSRTPLIILTFAAVTNAILTFIFVVPFQWGIAGSAYATVISQIMSALLVARSLHKSSPLTRISRKELRLDLPSAKEILKLGMPTAIQQAAMSIGGVVIQGFINSYGTENIAGYSAASRVDMFAFMPIMSLGMAMTSFTGQNVGAGKMDRVYKAAKQGVILSVCITLSLSGLLLIFGRYALLLFTDNAQTIAAGLTMLRTLVPFYFLFAINQPLGGVMRGSGETVIPMVNSLMMNLIVRIPLVVLLSYLYKRVEVIYWSQVLGWVYGAIHLGIIYRKGNWKKKALEKIATLYPDRAGPGEGGDSSGSGGSIISSDASSSSSDASSSGTGSSIISSDAGNSHVSGK